MLNNHTGIKLESNNGKLPGKFPDLCKINSIFLNDQFKEEIKRQIRKRFEVNENKNLQISNQKIVEISRDMMRDSLSEEDKQLIFKIFGSPKLPQIDQDTVILLTEPFSTDGVCSDEKQIIIYKVIIDDLIEKGLTVLIKPHPRDKMDYSIFGVDVIDRFFPMEVLVDQVGEKIQNIATVSSSAALSINAKNIYKYDFLQIKGEDNE